MIDDGMTRPGDPRATPWRAAPWRVIAIVAGLIALGVIVVIALNLRGSEAGPPTGGQPSASASTAASASLAPSASAAVETPDATAQPSASPPPEEFAQVATFPGAAASALTAWPDGWAAIGQTDAGATVWLSADGVAWEAIDSTGLEDGAINHLVAIPDGRLLAFGFRDDGSLGGASEAWISSDGRDWQTADLGIPGLLNAVDVAAGPLGLVMIGRAEPNASSRNEYVWYSENGLDWERVWETVGDEIPAAVAAGPEGFVIVGQQGYEEGGSIGVALASADGREWIEAPTDGPVGLGGMWSVVPIGRDWMATSLDVADVHVLHSPNGLDWTIDTAFPGADARRGGIAQLAGDVQFALLGSILVPRTVLPVALYTGSSGWRDTDASATGGIAAASRDGMTVLMVNAGTEDAPEVQFWLAATPG
jgi:hypothetical protein